MLGLGDLNQDLESGRVTALLCGQSRKNATLFYTVTVLSLGNDRIKS